MKRLLLFICAFVALGGMIMFPSCVSQEKILMLQNERMLNDTTQTSINYKNQRSFDYKVQPGDNLYIRITSLDDRFSTYFNMMNQSGGNFATVSNQNSSGNPAIYLNGYTVNDNGEIDFPMAGKVNVRDMTIEEIQTKIQAIMLEYLKETTIYVKLGLFNLTILGEVAKPGQYQIYQSDINIFQAIALAGNATDYANKKNVKIIHQTPDGSQIVRVNLNEADVLSDPNYYLKPNDIIYVEPMKIKQYGFTSIPYSTIISAVSLLVTCLTFVYIYVK